MYIYIYICILIFLSCFSWCLLLLFVKLINKQLTFLKNLLIAPCKGLRSEAPEGLRTPLPQLGYYSFESTQNLTVLPSDILINTMGNPHRLVDSQITPFPLQHLPHLLLYTLLLLSHGLQGCGEQKKWDSGLPSEQNVVPRKFSLGCLRMWCKAG